MSLYSNLVEVKKGERQNLLDALAIMSDFDNDFTGENWEETTVGGFKSNLEYLLDKVKEIKDDNEVVQIFLEEWMRNDANYYSEYSYNTITDNVGNVLAISFAVISCF